ncbi:hypothetical protein ABN584_26735 [Gloeocapsa sp. BRSZ]
MKATDTDDFQQQVLSRLDKLDADIKALQLNSSFKDTVWTTRFARYYRADTASAQNTQFPVSPKLTHSGGFFQEQKTSPQFQSQEQSEKVYERRVFTPTRLSTFTDDKEDKKNCPNFAVDINKEIRERGDRAIATAAGGAFLGGLIAQLPGAIAGGAFGALFGLFVRTKKTRSA